MTGTVFFDVGTRGDTLQLTINLLAPGGILIKDDLAPGAVGGSDAVREAFLDDERLVGVEILSTPSAAAIIAARRS